MPNSMWVKFQTINYRQQSEQKLITLEPPKDLFVADGKIMTSVEVKIL